MKQESLYRFINIFLLLQQADIYDRMELLRQEQILKARSLQTAPFEGDSRYAKLQEFVLTCAYHLV